MVQTHNHDVSLSEVSSQKSILVSEQLGYTSRLDVNLAIFNSGKSRSRSAITMQCRDDAMLYASLKFLLENVLVSEK